MNGAKRQTASPGGETLRPPVNMRNALLASGAPQAASGRQQRKGVKDNR
jgi:hypothetical protein